MADDESDEGSLLSLVERSIELVVVNERDEIVDNSIRSPPFKGNLYKICFQKKKLMTSLKHWINTKVNKTKCLPPSSSLDSYVQCAEKDGYSFGGNKPPVQGKAEPKLADHLRQISQENSLDVYHDGRLFEGVVVNQPNADEKRAVLSCAGKLYRQLWYLRCLLGRNVTSVFGFSICCGSGGQKGEWISLSTMKLNVPNSGCQIGARFQLFVHTHRQFVAPTLDLPQISAVENLGNFLLAPTNSGSHPSNAELLQSRYPGSAMLVSEELRRKIEKEIPWQIIPTITGSMVMRCRNFDAVRQILLATYEKQESAVVDIESVLMPLMDRLEEAELSSPWFIKCKTPAAFGLFWDTAEVAINGTRRRLTAMLQRKTLSREKIAVAKEWIHMHPVDSIVEPNRNITIIADMGIQFRGQLSWNDFLSAFLSLSERTMIFQDTTKLIHGDVYEGNVLLMKTNQLVLIDWDEALREKPCFRQTLTDEEKLRYPNALVDFPDLYTKQQLLVLFDSLVHQCYPSEIQSAWEHCISNSGFGESGEPVTAVVRSRYKSLYRFLTEKGSGPVSL